MKRTIRTFVAVEIDAAVRQRAAKLIALLSAAGADVKWVDAVNLHFTLKFLDEVSLSDIPELGEVVSRAVATIKPFDLEVHGGGAFPNAARPKTIWLGAGSGQEQMIALHGALEAALAKLGFRKEHRRFTPHLTLGRVRTSGPAVDELGQLLQQQAAFDAGECRVGQVVVFSSELTPEGPLYQALCRAKLGGK
jgi:2'-5' RNA ligase